MKVTKVTRGLLNKKAYSEINELNRQEIRTAITEFFNLLTDVFVSGCGVKFRGFGRFFFREHKSRTLYKVETKEYYETGVIRVLNFTPALKIKKLIKRGQ